MSNFFNLEKYWFGYNLHLATSTRNPLWIFLCVDRNFAPFFFLPVFDYPLHNGIRSEAVPAVNSTQDSFPPGLLDMNKTLPNESDLSSLWITVFHRGGECLDSYSIRVWSILVRIYFCLSMAYKINLGMKRCPILFIFFNCREHYYVVVKDNCATCTYLEMVQQIFCDCKGCTNHHFWHVL